MCFVNDYDWCAEVHHQADGERPEAAQCYECGRVIVPYEWRRHVEQWEYGSCQVCEDEFSDRWTTGAKPCDGAHDYGETFEASTCRECCRMLEAIEAVEREAGCPDGSRQPGYGEMCDAVYEDARDCGRYVLRAVTTWPELLGVEWIRKASELAKGGAE